MPADLAVRRPRKARPPRPEPSWTVVVDPDAPPVDVAALDAAVAALLLDLVRQDRSPEMN